MPGSKGEGSVRLQFRFVLSMAAVAALCAAVAAAAAVTSSPSGTTSTARSAASPEHWKPWLLTSANQFRLDAPPAATSKQTKTEVAELLRLQRHRTRSVNALITKWCRQPAVVPWTELQLKLIQSYRPRVAPSARVLALLGVGMYDAMVAADDSHQAYAKSSRPAPWVLDKRLKPAMNVPAGSTWSPADAAVAGAAEKILAYLYPAEPKRTFTSLANEAVNARLDAGLNYRSDLEQARLLGQKVATVVIARGEADNHTVTGFSEGPFTGEQYWVPTPP